jgi:hypothetical protein
MKKRYCLLALALATFAVQAATVDFTVTTPQPIVVTAIAAPMLGGGTATVQQRVVAVAVHVTGNATPGSVSYFQTGAVSRWLGYGGTVDANGVPAVQQFNLPAPGTYSVVAQFTETGSRVAGSPPPAVSKSAPVTIVAK